MQIIGSSCNINIHCFMVNTCIAFPRIYFKETTSHEVGNSNLFNVGTSKVLFIIRLAYTNLPEETHE